MSVELMACSVAFQLVSHVGKRPYTEGVRHAQLVRRPCILIVEEVADIVSLLRSLLDDEGFGTVGTSYRNEGIAMARRNRVDLFIVDLGWHGHTHIELVNDLRTPINRATPALGMSASSERVDQAQASGLYDEVTPKPFDFEIVLAIVHRLTGWPDE